MRTVEFSRTGAVYNRCAERVTEGALRAGSFRAVKEEADVNKLFMVVTVAAALALGGCQEVRNETLGQGVGGALGGLLGAQIGHGKGRLAATAAGAIAGLMIGGRIGRSMDEVDRQRTQRTLESAPTGHTSSWRNPDSGAEYAVTPTRTYQSDGQDCRDYTTRATINGREENVQGTACRQPDGSWRAI